MIHGILRYSVDKKFIAEITLKPGVNLEHFTQILFEQPMKIKNNVFTITPSRSMRNQVKNPLTRVYIYEAPFQMPSSWIRHKLSQFGQLVNEEIYEHKYYNTEIFNGVRSISFSRIDTPIPTTLFVRGNRIRLRHENQDRRPICGICKTKGHYRDKCPELQRQEQNYTDLDNPPLPQTEQDMRAEWNAKVEEQRIRNERKMKAQEEKDRKKQQEQEKLKKEKLLEQQKNEMQKARDMNNRKRNSPSDVDTEDDFQTFHSRRNHRLEVKLKRLALERETEQDISHDDDREQNRIPEDREQSKIHETTLDMTINNTQIDSHSQATPSDGSVSSETSTETSTMKSQSSGSGYITGDEVGQSTDRDGDDELDDQDLQQSDAESVHSLGHSHPPPPMCSEQK